MNHSILTTMITLFAIQGYAQNIDGNKQVTL